MYSELCMHAWFTHHSTPISSQRHGNACLKAAQHMLLSLPIASWCWFKFKMSDLAKSVAVIFRATGSSEPTCVWYTCTTAVHAASVNSLQPSWHSALSSKICKQLCQHKASLHPKHTYNLLWRDSYAKINPALKRCKTLCLFFSLGQSNLNTS